MADERIPTLDENDRLPDKFMPERLSASSLDAAYGGGGGGGGGYSDGTIDSMFTANSAGDRNRANHSGTQLASTISDFTEATQDVVGSLIVAGTGITATYNDATGELTLEASGSGGGGLDAEGVRDVMAATLVAGTGVTITEDDGLNTITIDATGGGGSSDAFLLDRANHTGTQAQTTVTDLVDDLAGKSDVGHTHTKANITDFAHTHTKSAITDFAHTHTKSDITDFAHTHGVADMPPGTTLSVIYNGSAWPARPTARTDVIVQWIDYLGTSATPSGGVSGVDLYIKDAGI